jgi:hypothetical protein
MNIRTREIRNGPRISHDRVALSPSCQEIFDPIFWMLPELLRFPSGIILPRGFYIIDAHREEAGPG